jgi:putative transposase
MCVQRRQRLTDGTLTLDGVRFEVPMRFRHMERLTLAYARWDLSKASIIDPNTRQVTVDIFPLDKVKNSLRLRKPLSQEEQEPIPEPENEHLPPLLQRYLKQQSQETIVSGYIPFEKEKNK